MKLKKENEKLFAFCDEVPVEIQLDQGGNVMQKEKFNSAKWYFTGSVKKPTGLYFDDNEFGLGRLTFSEEDGGAYKLQQIDGQNKTKKLEEHDVIFDSFIKNPFLKGKLKALVRGTDITPRAGLNATSANKPLEKGSKPNKTLARNDSRKTSKLKTKANKSGDLPFQKRIVEFDNLFSKIDSTPSTSSTMSRTRGKMSRAKLKGTTLPQRDQDALKGVNVKAIRKKMGAKIMSGLQRQLNRNSSAHSAKPQRTLNTHHKTTTKQDKIKLLNDGIAIMNAAMDKLEDYSKVTPKLSQKIQEQFTDVPHSAIHIGPNKDKIEVEFNGDDIGFSTTGNSIEMVESTVYLYLKANCQNFQELLDNAAKDTPDKNIKPILNGGSLLTFDVESDDSDLIDKFRKTCEKYNMQLYKDYLKSAQQGIKSQTQSPAASAAQNKKSGNNNVPSPPPSPPTT